MRPAGPDANSEPRAIRAGALGDALELLVAADLQVLERDATAGMRCGSGAERSNALVTGELGERAARVTGQRQLQRPGIINQCSPASLRLREPIYPTETRAFRWISCTNASAALPSPPWASKLWLISSA